MRIKYKKGSEDVRTKENREVETEASGFTRNKADGNLGIELKPSF